MTWNINNIIYNILKHKFLNYTRWKVLLKTKNQNTRVRM